MTADLPTDRVLDWLKAKAQRDPEAWWTIHEIAHGIGSPDATVQQALQNLHGGRLILYISPMAIDGGKARIA